MTPRTASPSAHTSGVSPVEVGRWLFRRRAVLAAPWVVLLLVLPPEFQPSFLTVGLALIGIALAEVVRVLAVGHAAGVLGAGGEESRELVIAGPFRHVRNPIYLGNIILLSSAAVLFGFAWFALVIAVALAVQYRFVVSYEEATLMSTFGTPYLRYLRAVPRWLPSMSPQHSSTGHRFSLQQALVSERSVLAALVALPLLLIVKTALLA